MPSITITITKQELRRVPVHRQWMLFKTHTGSRLTLEPVQQVQQRISAIYKDKDDDQLDMIAVKESRSFGDKNNNNWFPYQTVG